MKNRSTRRARRTGPRDERRIAGRARKVVFVLPPNNYAQPDATLLADLRRVARAMKTRTLSRRTYDRCGRFCAMTIANRFGSWTRGLQRAGLRSAFQPVSTEALLINLYAAWRRCDGKPAARRVTAVQRSRWPWQTYVNRFGTWYAALRALDRWMKIPANRAKAQRALRQMNRTRGGARRARPFIDRANAARGSSETSSGWVSAGVRYRVLARDGFRCRACGRSPAMEPGVVLHVDHVRPRARGGGRGGKSLRNLQTLCRECNLGKGTHGGRQRRGCSDVRAQARLNAGG